MQSIPEILGKMSAQDPSEGPCESLGGCITGRILKSRWHVFSASLLAVVISGTSYAFGIFSEVFKDKLGFSQLELSIIGSFGSTGLYTGLYSLNLVGCILFP